SGNLGQDARSGGIADFCGVVTPDHRPDGSDLSFGAAGTRIGRDADTSPTADTHPRDADVIVGDNGRIVRIVGINGTDVGTATKYVTFVYDALYGTRLVGRGVPLLDYTDRGPALRT